MFEKSIEYKVIENGCWICVSHKSSSGGGHPCKTINGKSIRISNIMYEKYKSPIPNGTAPYNTCGTPQCINPDHLNLGILGVNNWKKPTPIIYYINGNGCWICTSHRPNSKGYPLATFNKKIKLISHVMYEKYKGGIPVGLCVLHTCDIRLCINPDHLWLGTKADNNLDRGTKGRSAVLLGEQNKNVKLTECQVLEIINSSESLKKLSDRFGVGKAAIWKIKNKITWSHIHLS